MAEARRTRRIEVSKLTILAIAVVLAHTGLIGCGGGGGGGGLNLTNVQTNEGAARSAQIGPEGGTITAGAGGAGFSLTIPAASLGQATKITMTPVVSVTGMTAGRGVVAGVHLTPEGLILPNGAELKITLPAGVDPSTVVAFAYKGDRQDLQLYPARIAGQDVIFDITHFSGYGLGDLLLEELLRAQPQTSSLTAQFQSRMATAFLDSQNLGASPVTAYRVILEEWRRDLVIPNLQIITNAADALDYFSSNPLQIIADTKAYVDGVEFARETSNSQVGDEELTPIHAPIEAAARHGITLMRAGCSADDVNEALRQADESMFLQAFAQRQLQAALPADLSGTAVREGLCVQPQVGFTLENFALEPGDSDTISGLTRVLIGGQVTGGSRMKVQVRRDGVPFGQPSDMTSNSQGEFASDFTWPPQLNRIEIVVRTFLPLPRFPDSVPSQTTLIRPAHPFVGRYQGTFSGGGDGFNESGTFTARINDAGQLTAQGTVTRTFNGGTQSLPFTATGLIQLNGQAIVTGTAGSGAAACPFNFNGTFRRIEAENTVTGNGDYAAQCANDNDSFGSWSCSKQ